jgi:hypothetical protein
LTSKLISSFARSREGDVVSLCRTSCLTVRCTISMIRKSQNMFLRTVFIITLISITRGYKYSKAYEISMIYTRPNCQGSISSFQHLETTIDECREAQCAMIGNSTRSLKKYCKIKKPADIEQEVTISTFYYKDEICGAQPVVKNVYLVSC